MTQDFVTLPTEHAISQGILLMPRRDDIIGNTIFVGEAENSAKHVFLNRRYGIDLAWQLESLGAWMTAMGGSPQRVSMSPHPKAADINTRNTWAKYVKTEQERGSWFTRPRLLGDVPVNDCMMSSVLPTNLIVSFGDVPGDVSVGASVKKEHVSSMFEWMDDVRAYGFAGSLWHGRQSPVVSEWTVDDSSYGADPGYRPSHGNACLYSWDWISNVTASPHYGYSQRLSAKPFRVDFTVSGLQSKWFESAQLFLKLDVNHSGSFAPSGGSIDHVFAPCGNDVLISQSGDGLQISAYVSGSAGTAAASKAGATEEPYVPESGMSQSIIVVMEYDYLCFLKFKDLPGEQYWNRLDKDTYYYVVPMAPNTPGSKPAAERWDRFEANIPELTL